MSKLSPVTTESIFSGDAWANAELFELRFPDGRIVKLYGNGRTEGLPSGTIILNKIPRVRHALQIPPTLSDRARGNLPLRMNSEAVPR